ncbi:MAG: OmpA family protein [Kofleriaceae bacterium]
MVDATLLEDPDGDGIITRDDRCPNRAEDVDLFEDDDGCPDLDNDGDGRPDDRDQCPMAAEDRDGFEDDDGCPDLDNDGDRVADATDACPDVPEDIDNFQDLDGCPDLDDDGDGIPDLEDRCPQAAETINGVKDDDGCPDEGESLVLLSGDKIELLDRIRFGKGNAILAKSSFNILGQVAATLRAHPEIAALSIEVHLPDAGGSEQALSEARAQAILDWLSQWGVPEARLRAVGRGASAPLVPKGDKLASTLNDRVELIVVPR